MSINTDNELLKAIRSGKEKDICIAELEAVLTGITDNFALNEFHYRRAMKVLEGK